MSVAEAGAKHDKAVLGIEREIVIMKLIDHPNVMSLYDVWETAKELYLVLEYVEGGELFDYLVSCGRLHPDEASRYFQQIVAGVDYCHRFNICHRDLKPENLLLDAEKNIKIADFGMAALEPSDRLLETSCGSPHYASPEIVAGLSYHGAASDIWSCGVILFALLTGRLPFDDENIRVLLQKVKNGRFAMPADLPADAKDLITRMLVVDPEKRITMAEIMRHPFFQRRQDTDSGRRLHVVEPPRLEEIARPVRSEREIDRDILRNLRTLWQGSSEREIVHSLLSTEKTWEKAFYFLLLQYRNKHLENFNPEPEQHRNERRRKEGHKRTSRPPSVTAVRKIAPREERRHHDKGESPKTASRAAPATPSRTRQVVGPRAPPPVEAKLDKPSTTGTDGPKTPVNADKVKVQSTITPIDPRLPKITLQRPTPQADTSTPSRTPAGLGLSIGAPPSPSPSPSPAPSIYSPSSPPLGGIEVPQVNDAALQKFFHDIAEQLQLIGSASPRSSLAMDSPALSQGESTAPPSPLPTPITAEAPTLPPIVTRPVPQRAATTDSGSGSVGVGGPRPVPEKRRSYLGDASARDNVQAHTAAHQRFSTQGPLEKTRKPILSSTSESKRKSKPAPLDLSPKIMQHDQLLSPTGSPYLGSAPPSPLLVGPRNEAKQSWFSNLFSWKPAMFTLISADDCASSRAECIKLLESFGASVIVEDADGWGLLKCRVDEIRDVTGIIILKSVKFRIEFLPHASWSSPTTTTTTATNNTTASSTGGRRSPLTSPNPSLRGTQVHQGTGPITTSMTMVQEKGALSAFKAVYGRIRAEWRLDSLKSPALGGNSRFTSSPLASPAISGENAQALWS
ncbi:hypothetical protein BCR39DRAFT_519287 [Naematelia encephala]|uniref:non-specific serine/threonine protein kinase n=1 Tax=Naematelia encephala TaxID=71784 RepID=A0A1Y2BG59_9TREE|nr:hypothetical protein BCR39DRAFT_519287 [Naematelia encephala]